MDNCAPDQKSYCKDGGWVGGPCDQGAQLDAWGGMAGPAARIPRRPTTARPLNHQALRAGKTHKCDPGMKCYLVADTHGISQPTCIWD